MPDVTIDDDVLTVRLTTGEKVAGVLRDLVVPVSAVRSARAVPDGLPEVRGLRAPGLALPGRRKYGTWRRRGGRTYAAVRSGAPALVLELDGQRYDTAVVTTAAADALATRLGRPA